MGPRTPGACPGHAEGWPAARVCSLETDRLPDRFVGRRFDETFLTDLPDDVDPSGEEGEFHTFVERAPGWRGAVATTPTSTIERYGFAFAELEPVDHERGREPGVPTSQTVPPFEPFIFYRRLVKVKDYVDAELDQAIDVASAARIAAMTPQAFGRFFRRATGMSFHRWLVEHRLARAWQLLRDHSDPIQNVAATCGFGSDRTFRRRFHDRFGCTPQEYRASTTRNGAR